MNPRVNCVLNWVPKTGQDKRLAAFADIWEEKRRKKSRKKQHGK